MPQTVLSTYHTPDRQIARAGASSSGRLLALIPLLLVFYSFLLLPPEVEVTVYGVNLPSYRMALLAMTVPALWMLLKEKMGATSPIDIAVTIIAFWIVLSFTMIYGFESGIVRGAGIMIDTALPYVIARACVKTMDDLRYFLLLCLPGLLFAGGVLALESLSGRLLLRPAFASVFGSISAFSGGEASGSLIIKDEYRLGLLRAYGPFPHPILAGIAMVGFLPLYYFSGLRGWPYVLGIVAALTGFFALSSAAFLALIVAVGAILIYHVKPYIPKISWWTISAMLVLMLWSVHMVSKNGIIPVISRLTLTPATADYRTLIWEFGSISVANNPWFGIGYRQWERLSWMGESVDAHFLLLAMRHGLVVPVLLLIAMTYGMIRLGIITPFLTARDRSFAIGLNISLIIYLVVGQTVNYFGSTNLIFMTVIAFLASTVSWGNRELKMHRSQMLAYAAGRFYPPAASGR